MVVLAGVVDADHPAGHGRGPRRARSGDAGAPLCGVERSGGVGLRGLDDALCFLALPRQRIEAFGVAVLNPAVDQFKIDPWEQFREPEPDLPVGHLEQSYVKMFHAAHSYWKISGVPVEPSGRKVPGVPDTDPCLMNPGVPLVLFGPNTPGVPPVAASFINPGVPTVCSALKIPGAGGITFTMGVPEANARLAVIGPRGRSTTTPCPTSVSVPDDGEYVALRATDAPVNVWVVASGCSAVASDAVDPANDSDPEPEGIFKLRFSVDPENTSVPPVGSRSAAWLIPGVAPENVSAAVPGGIVRLRCSAAPENVRLAVLGGIVRLRPVAAAVNVSEAATAGMDSFRRSAAPVNVSVVATGGILLVNASVAAVSVNVVADGEIRFTFAMAANAPVNVSDAVPGGTVLFSVVLAAVNVSVAVPAGMARFSVAVCAVNVSAVAPAGIVRFSAGVAAVNVSVRVAGGTLSLSFSAAPVNVNVADAGDSPAVPSVLLRMMSGRAGWERPMRAMLYQLTDRSTLGTITETICCTGGIELATNPNHMMVIEPEVFGVTTCTAPNVLAEIRVSVLLESFLSPVWLAANETAIFPAAALFLNVMTVSLVAIVLADRKMVNSLT